MESCPLCYYGNPSQGTEDSTSDSGKFSASAPEKGKIDLFCPINQVKKTQIIKTKVPMQTRLAACVGNTYRFASVLATDRVGGLCQGYSQLTSLLIFFFCRD